MQVVRTTQPPAP